MSGLVLPVVPKRVVDFAGLPIGNTRAVVLADRVELVPWRSVTMLARIHEHSIAAGTSTITIRAIPQSWTAEEPGLLFLFDAPNLYPDDIVLNSSTPSPEYLSSALRMTDVTDSDSMSAMCRIVALADRTASGSLSVTLSIELAVKDA